MYEIYKRDKDLGLEEWATFIILPIKAQKLDHVFARKDSLLVHEMAYMHFCTSMNLVFGLLIFCGPQKQFVAHTATFFLLPCVSHSKDHGWAVARPMSVVVRSAVVKTTPVSAKQSQEMSNISQVPIDVSF